MTYMKYLIPAFLALGIVGAFSSIPSSVGPVSESTYDPDAISKSIVRITNALGNAGGTGFAVRAPSDHVVIVTNDHVCKVAVSERVYVRDASRAVIGRIVKRNFEHDLCAVDIGPLAPTPLPVATNELSRFSAVFVQGHPLLMPQAPVQGRVIGRAIETIGFRPDEDGTCPPPSEVRESFFGSVCVLNMELIATTLQIFPGNSGSPVLNAQGEVSGVVNSGDTRTGWGGYIPLPHFKEFMRGL